MPASVAGRGDAEQQSTVLPPDPLSCGRFLWLTVCVRRSGGAPIKCDPFEIRFGKSERFPPFANDEERSCNEYWASVSRRGDVNRDGDRPLDLMGDAKSRSRACDEVWIGGTGGVSPRDDEVLNKRL